MPLHTATAAKIEFFIVHCKKEHMARVVRYAVYIEESSPTEDTTCSRETIELPLVENTDLNRAIHEYFDNGPPGVRLIAVDSITIVRKCIACQEGQPGQPAHMEPGGYLYMQSPQNSQSPQESQGSPSL